MSTIVRVRRSFCGLVAVCAPFANAAGSADDPQVIVTASRASERIDDALWSSTVVTRADIESQQATSVQEVLANLAGIDTDNAGGLGKATSVFIRGAGPGQTLLLIDGVRVGSATLGIGPFELIPIDQVERIEVVRGPRSTLYGADAGGGVVQIFTRNGAHPGLAFGASVTGESHDTHQVSTDLRAAGEHAWVNIGAESLETAGISACLGAAFTARCNPGDPDHDGFRSHAASLAAGYRFSDRLTADLHALIQKGNTQYDGTFTNEADVAERVFAVHVDGSLSRAWQAHLVVGHNEDVQDNGLDGVPMNHYLTKRDSASAQLDGALASNLRLIAGVDHQDDRVESSTQYVRTSRHTTGVFTELRAERGQWSGLAGVRDEDNQQFGTHVVGNVGLARKLAEHYRVTATWGTAFRAPTFNDLYFPSFDPNFAPPSDPNLKPEESRSAELGFEALFARARASLHLYQTHFDQLITFDLTTFRPVNVGSARVRGAELQVEYRTDTWKIGGQITRLDPLNLGQGGAPDTLLPRRARDSGSLEVRRFFPSTSIAAITRWEGRRFDDLANLAPLGGYATLDLVAEQSIGRAWKLAARVANVLDHDYATARYYPQDGRHYGVTLRYTFAGERP